MATLSSATGTGHSPRGERKVAGLIYIILSITVVAAVAVFFFASKHEKLDPYKADRPAAVAPDVPTEAPGDRSGAVAAPQNESAPPAANETK